MTLALMALLIVLNQFQPTPIMATHPLAVQPFARSANTTSNFYNTGRINLNSPLSGSVLVAQAIRAGRVRIPYLLFPQLEPFVLTCSPAPCTTPNVRTFAGASPMNETPIAANPLKASQLLTGANDYNCGAIQGFMASSTGGSTWNHTCMGLLSGGSGAGDPAVGYDRLGNAYIMGIDTFSGTVSEIAFEKSSNNGATWSAPALAISGIAPYTFVDKEWMQIDDSAASPRKNAIYASTTEFDPNSNSIIAVSHSTDGGGSWMNVMVDAVKFPVVDQFSDLAIGSDGMLYLTWMRCAATGPTGNCGGTKSKILFSKSADGGMTWSKPVLVANANLTPDSCGAFYGCLPNTSERVSNVPAIDVDRTAGPFKNRLYTVMYNWTGAKMQVKVSRSTNGGATWSVPVPVAAAVTKDQFFPWLTTSSTGTVGVTWLDRRLDPANKKYNAFATISTNGGVSFGTSVKVSTATSDPANDGFGGSFMGDYTGDIWVGPRLFDVWTDTRIGDAQDEIGAYKIL